MKYLLILLLTTSFCFAQEFKNDWADFKVPQNWTMEFEKDTSPLLDKGPIGTLYFTNKENPQIIVLYYVFTEKDINDSFREKLKNWYIVQSCLTQTGNHQPLLTAFDSKQFYYTIKPCTGCGTSKNEDCGKLADAIFKFVSPQSKWTTLDLINEQR
jgi:hypothetical protein